MSEAIDVLKQRWLSARGVENEARNELVTAALNAYRFDVGDLVKVYGKTGRIVRISAEVRERRGSGADVIIRPSIFPLKKDGSVAKVGEIFLWNDEDLTPAECK